ncbi:MAG: helix-turn-helix transcriptional regulator [Acidobacteriota bacterium]|nr:helix-turn-helix transcriptional regulator [Acidobacteriota bacterium]
MNDGEPYSMEIDELEAVSTCCVFFKKGFVESLYYSFSSSQTKLLDDPAVSVQPLSFLSRLHPKSNTLAVLMDEVRNHALARAPAINVEELYMQVAHELLLEYSEVQQQLTRIRAARSSTRAEILRRVSRGREYLHGEAYGDVTLAAAADAACMSPFHFHRSFVQAFSRTPAQYVAELRFSKAIQLLKQGTPVTSVCLSVGFESVSSFSTAFRKRVGISPRALRPGNFARFDKFPKP